MTDVKIFADYIEENAVSQVKKIAEGPAFAGEAIRIMPDAHSGSGCVVGFTSTFRHGRVIPAVVGVDIGCGVLAVETTMKAAEKTYKKLDKVICSYIPTGIEHFDEPDEKTLAIAQNNLTFKLDPEATVLAARSLGTLGGGNHFIELDQHPDTKRLWLTVHTGSRNLGLQIARHHQEIASEHDGFLEGDFAAEYLHDLAIAQQFAQDNRRAIVEAIGKHMGFNALSEVESVHNYIDLERKVTRKGAIAAYEGQPVVVPLNMAAGIVLGTGRGMTDWNCSAPHGAGRMLSRSAAQAKISLDQYRRDMKGIYSTCVGKRTLDESPRAYKSAGSIKKQLEQTVCDAVVCKSVYNYKAS